MGQFVKVCKKSELGSESAKCVEVEGAQIALFNLGGEFYAIGNQCTHRGGPLAEGAIEGDEVECPWHGARYKITTGEVLTPPAPSGVPKYSVRVTDEDVEVEV